MYNSADVLWTLWGAAMVFFMQAGFSLCEAGLTRAKNTGNILMKNLMDFCIGTPLYWLVGFGLMFGGAGAFIGRLDPLIRGSYDFGTICVGLFATDGGLFYGGGVRFLLVQLAGVVSVAVWVLVTMTIIFKVIDKLVGLRVPAEVEIDGLDIHEHGLASAYSGFAITDVSAALDVNENTDLGEDDYEKAGEHRQTAAVPVVRTEPADPAASSGMYKVTIIARLSRFDELKTAMNQLGVTGMTVTQVMGCGIQQGAGEYYRGVEMDATLLPKIKVEIVVSSIPVDAVIETAKKALYTGHVGDGKIFVYGVQRVVKVRTGEEDFAALQDVE